MKKIRKSVFETNSSSTHTLTTITNQKNYLSKSNKIVVYFMDTDDETCLTTLKEKVSYLVAQIICDYKWDVVGYEDLKEQVEDDLNFKRIKDYVLKKYGKQVVLPKKYNIITEDEDGTQFESPLEDIVNINHQLRYDNFEDFLADLVDEWSMDLLGEVLDEKNVITFGRD